MAQGSPRRPGVLAGALLLVLPALVAPSTLADSEEPGWLGFRFTYQAPDGAGAVETFLFVQEAFSNGPAERGGLEKGDRILAIDGQPVVRFTEGAVVDFFLSVRAGQEVKLTVDREGGPVQLEIEAVLVPERYREARERLLELRRGARESGAEEQAEPPEPHS